MRDRPWREPGNGARTKRTRASNADGAAGKTMTHANDFCNLCRPMLTHFRVTERKLVGPHEPNAQTAPNGLLADDRERKLWHTSRQHQSDSNAHLQAAPQKQEERVADWVILAAAESRVLQNVRHACSAGTPHCEALGQHTRRTMRSTGTAGQLSAGWMN